MDSPIKSLTGIMCLSLISAAANADEFLNVTPFGKDVPLGPGSELITPLIVHKFIDADEVPDELVLSFNVWTAGTNTKLLQTQRRTRAFAAVPCVTPGEMDFDYDVRFFGADSADRVHMLMDTYVECWDSFDNQFKEQHKTIWYSANVSSNGASYVKVWDGWGVIGANAIDWDGDGTEELALMLSREKLNSTESRVIFMNFGNGSIEAANSYPVEFFF